MSFAHGTAPLTIPSGASPHDPAKPSLESRDRLSTMATTNPRETSIRAASRILEEIQAGADTRIDWPEGAKAIAAIIDEVTGDGRRGDICPKWLTLPMAAIYSSLSERFLEDLAKSGQVVSSHVIQEGKTRGRVLLSVESLDALILAGVDREPVKLAVNSDRKGGA